jgi:hypothetical protein
MAAGAGPSFDPDDEIEAGEVWMMNLRSGKQTRIDKDGEYRTPVLAPGGTQVYALRWNARARRVCGRQPGELVRFPIGGGDAEEVMPFEGASKLLGFAPDGRLLLMIDDDIDPPLVGLLAPNTRKLTWLPVDEQSGADEAAMVRLRGWERVYGDTKLTVRPQVQGGRRWTDVFLVAPGKPATNVSRCRNAACGEASLSSDGRTLLFIKSGMQ